VYDDIYAPAYRLAARYGKAVFIHTGDTYSERGLLEYSHPLKIDRLAGMYRDVNFVLAHMGDPWIIDACELAYKNANVYLDASGLVVGEEKEISRVRDEPLLRDRFRQGILFLNDYDKLLFGTDWPLAAMKPYIGFCKTLVPEPFHDKFFYENAVRVYRIGGCCI
jgi:predicted TIM-barrel fold metal-dependent hydrolase